MFVGFVRDLHAPASPFIGTNALPAVAQGIEYFIPFMYYVYRLISTRLLTFGEDPHDFARSLPCTKTAPAAARVSYHLFLLQTTYTNQNLPDDTLFIRFIRDPHEADSPLPQTPSQLHPPASPSESRPVWQQMVIPRDTTRVPVKWKHDDATPGHEDKPHPSPSSMQLPPNIA